MNDCCIRNFLTKKIILKVRPVRGSKRASAHCFTAVSGAIRRILLILIAECDCIVEFTVLNEIGASYPILNWEFLYSFKYSRDREWPKMTENDRA